MSPMPELIPMLKQLRLSGILDSIESRNRQAIEEKFSYMDFLATIVQDEIARRTQKRLESAVRRANFRNQKTLEEFDFTFNPNINRALITELASCRFMEEKVSVLIVGPCGTGKSHIAQAIGHCAIRVGYDVLFTNASRMLAQINAARATNGFERQFAKLTGVDLLIIDDFGLKPLTGVQDEDFHEVISERYERRSTIVTSNLDVSEWPDAFPNRILGAAFFPVGDEIRAIVSRWVSYLRDERLWGNDDPLFPATLVVLGPDRQFAAVGLAREHWSTAAPIRSIFREAFMKARLPYFNPHSFRNTLAQLGEEVCKTPEQFKAWSQNLRHEKVLSISRMNPLSVE